MTSNKSSSKKNVQKILNSAGYDISKFIRVKFPTAPNQKAKKSSFSPSLTSKLVAAK